MRVAAFALLVLLAVLSQAVGKNHRKDALIPPDTAERKLAREKKQAAFLNHKGVKDRAKKRDNRKGPALAWDEEGKEDKKLGEHVLAVSQHLSPAALTSHVTRNQTKPLAKPWCATTHKWGTILLKQVLIPKYGLSCTFKGRIAHRLPRNSIVVARNVQESIVSGYLYHKGGHECWLDINGTPNPYPQGGNDWLRERNWAKVVNSVPYTAGYQANTNLCEVLASAPVEMGLGIYAEFALRTFLTAPMMLRSTGNAGVPVLYICMEDLAELAATNQSQLDVDMEQVRQHLLLGGDVRPDASRRRLYEGGHSTHGMVTSEERTELVALVNKVDKAYLKEQLQRAQALFQCGPRVSPPESHLLRMVLS